MVISNIHFAALNKKWKVQNIYPSDGGEQSELEKVLYGYVKANK